MPEQAILSDKNIRTFLCGSIDDLARMSRGYKYSVYDSMHKRKNLLAHVNLVLSLSGAVLYRQQKDKYFKTPKS